ncbi:PQQ-like beta-propeller repeat protein [candidate division WOR-3 bacterium]|nr:PQQ-like beta-propeller repeat protein [candidate division WOR-3 bacterium]
MTRKARARAGSVFPAMALAAMLAAVSGCPRKAPARPEKPSGRDRVATTSVAAYTTFTTDPNQDSVLYVFDWGDSRADTTGLLPPGDSASAAHQWPNVGSYSVRARAQNAKGYWSGWSEKLDVTVTVNHPPEPPLRPTHTGTDSVGQTIAFTTSATDEDGDSVRIRYFFSEGQVSAFSPNLASGATYTDSVVYSQNGWKVIYAGATDGTDTSDWSAPDSVYVLSPNVAPYAPVIRYEYTPQRGIANGPAYRFYASAIDRYGDSLYYRWYFDGTDSVTSELFPSGVDGYVEWTPVGDTHSYSVSVRVFDVSGRTNPTTPMMVFKTVAEGELIWGISGEFDASPAIGPSLWRGDTRTGIVCGSVEGYLYVVDAYQAFAINQLSVLDPDAYNSSAAIGADGTRYVGNENGWFYAFGIDDSRDTFRWRFGNGLDGMTATGALATDGSIFCGGEDQRITKLSSSGTRQWSYSLRQWMASSPAIGPDNRIYCCDGSGYVYALNSDSTLSWEISVGTNVFITASPAVSADGTVYVCTEDGRLLALKDGGITWSYEVTPQRGISSSPVLGSDGNIYFGCDNGKLYRIDQNTHEPVSGWPVTVSVTDIVSNTPLLCADDIVYVADDSSLYAFDLNDPGSGPRWKTGLAVPSGKNAGGRLSLDNQPSPVVDQYGIVYIATGSGLFAVAGRPGGTLAATDWPMFHHDARHTGRFGAK